MKTIYLLLLVASGIYGIVGMSLSLPFSYLLLGFWTANVSVGAVLAITNNQ